MHKRIALPCAVLALALTTAACGGSGSATQTTTTTATTSAAASGASTTSGTALTVKDPWVKAVKGGMTGVFATLDNPTDEPIHIVRAESPVSRMVQLHVTEKDATGAMVMKETKDGFIVPAKGTFELRPGGNHVMLMGLGAPILSGTTTPVTLVAEDGTRTEIAATAREFNGAKESYAGMSMTPNQTAPGAAPSTTHP